MLDPALPSSLSTVTTSSSATFSCLPPQRTIAYTRELSFVALSLRAPERRWSPRRLACTSGPAQRATPDRQGYQTAEHPRTQTVRRREPAVRRRRPGPGGGLPGIPELQRGLPVLPVLPGLETLMRWPRRRS